MAKTPVRAANLALQQLALRSVLANVSEARVRQGELACVFRLQPSPASQTYTLRLTYRHRCKPKVWVSDPLLILHPGATRLPHVHKDDDLCLWYPREWADNMLLAHTVVPWTAEWLIHYELWLATGRWLGGGHVSVNGVQTH